MVKSNTLNTKWLQILIPIMSIGLVAGLLFIQQNTSPVNIFNFRFNAYAIISLVSVAVNVSFLTFVATKRRDFKSAEITWYILFLCAIILFGIFEMLQRLSATPEAAIYWAAFSGIGPAFIGAGLLLFSLQFSNPDAKLNLFIPVVLLTGATIFYFFGHGDLFFINNVGATRLYPWGYNNEVGKAFVLDVVWALGLGIMGLAVMSRFRKKTKSKILKKQSLIFIIALAIPTVGALIFDGIVPAMGVKAPPLGLLFTVTTAGIMLYGLNRYKLFRITPASISADIFSTMTESVVVTDNNLQIYLMNNSAYELFNEHNLNNINTSLIDIFNEGEAKKIVLDIKDIPQHSSKHILGSYVFDTNKYLRIAVVRTTEEHGVEGYIFAISDITELHDSYKALEAEKSSVEQKVRERTKELREAQNKLAETDKIKTEFVILTSHNLRTPLTTIKGNLEFLEESKLTTDQTKFVESLSLSTKRLSNLIEELLTISEIESGGNSSLRDINISGIVEILKDEGQELSKTSGIKFKFINETQNIMIKANSARLITALHNVLDNAFKFTKDGEVSVSVARDGNNVSIKIKDTGVGIDADEVPKLFTKFHRGTDYMQYDYEGEGIGLYLAKLIIEEHRGTIEINSQKGSGTEVAVTLPIGKT